MYLFQKNTINQAMVARYVFYLAKPVLKMVFDFAVQRLVGAISHLILGT